MAGGAGFIGSHLADRLITEGYRVVAVDNLVLGRAENLRHLFSNPNFTFVLSDLSLPAGVDKLFRTYGFDVVFHFAANSDIKASAFEPVKDLKNTFLTSINILEGMRKYSAKEIIFASSSAVYGNKPRIKIREDIGDLNPASYYGGAKLASEAFITSYCHMNDIKSWILRFPNVVGGRLTHGVIHDFINKLKQNPTRLEILGNGQQCKPYLHINDLIEAIIYLWHKGQDKINCFNIGVDSGTSVVSIADMVCAEMGLKNVQYLYSGGRAGWPGDVPEFRYDLGKIKAAGWKPRHTSDEAVRLSIRKMLQNRP